MKKQIPSQSMFILSVLCELFGFSKFVRTPMSPNIVVWLIAALAFAALGVIMAIFED